jgi:dTDP-4-amino-4,6-dideoxy-D-galactose acyltransferase
MSADAASFCRFLEWDSAFFGKRVASIMQTRLDETLTRKAVEWAREHAIDCLYVLTDSDDVDTVRRIEDAGARLVDVRMTFDRTIEKVERASSANVRACRESDIPALRALASKSHTASRFYADGRFAAERCDELYATWIEKSCRGWAETVLVAVQDGKPAGYLSCHMREERRGEIGIVAVAPEAQGRGVGGALLDSSLAWFAERDLERVTVVTQGRNGGAQRLYQSRGFRTAVGATVASPVVRSRRHTLMTKYRIPFNKPSFAGNETRYIADAIERGHISGDGHYSKACHKLLEDSLGARKVLLTTKLHARARDVGASSSASRRATR